MKEVSWFSYDYIYTFTSVPSKELFSKEGNVVNTIWRETLVVENSGALGKSMLILLLKFYCS